MCKAKVSKVIAFVGALIVPILLGTNSTQAQTVSYALGTSSALIDGDFYAGMQSAGSAVVEAPSGRGILNVGINQAGTKALFWGINLGTFQIGLFMVDVGYPSTWERVSSDEGFGFRPIVWCADDVHAWAGSGLLFDTNTRVLQRNVQLTPGFTYTVNGTTKKPSENWIVANGFNGDGHLRITPVLNDGQGDYLTRFNIDLTNFTIAPTERLVGDAITRDGDEIIFSIRDESVAPDLQNVYRLTGVNDIVDGFTAPAASLADPRINEIRASATPNYACCGEFSFDGSLVFSTEDYLNVFDSQNFIATVSAADWDINLSNADGSGYLRFSEPGGQGSVQGFDTGNRLYYIDQYNVKVTTLTTESDIDAESDPLPDGANSATIGGNSVTLPFTLGDSGVQTTTDVVVSDASGTIVDLPTDQVINFPDGSGATGITIVTPVDPVAPIALPDPETAIPVIRDFGPDGTLFFPPITITITYSDAEVAQIADEANMIPYLYNVGLGVFEPLDSAFLPTVVVDTVNNTLTFQTDHFSTYGIGGAVLMGAPQRDWTLVVLAAAIGLLAAAGFAGLIRTTRGAKRG